MKALQATCRQPETRGKPQRRLCRSKTDWFWNRNYWNLPDNLQTLIKSHLAPGYALNHNRIQVCCVSQALQGRLRLCTDTVSLSVLQQTSVRGLETARKVQSCPVIHFHLRNSCPCPSAGAFQMSPGCLWPMDLLLCCMKSSPLWGYQGHPAGKTQTQAHTPHPYKPPQEGTSTWHQHTHAGAPYYKCAL